MYYILLHSQMGQKRIARNKRRRTNDEGKSNPYNFFPEDYYGAIT
jgi:hypothetical protein